MMFRTGASIVALCTAAALQTAWAADMPVKAPAPVPVAAVYSWTGFYVGAHVGYGWGRSNSTILEATNAFFPQGHVNELPFDGVLGGGQIGYNWQSGQFVFGIEIDGAWSGIDGYTVNTAVLVANREARTNNQVDWIIMATGRLGIAAGPGLYYIKGGAAWADFGSTINSVNTVTGALLQTTSGGETRLGWTIGGGAEFALGRNWSIKGEYNYLDFGTDTVTRSGTNFVTGLAVSNEREVDSHIHVVKFGINYRFGGGTPVVARY